MTMVERVRPRVLVVDDEAMCLAAITRQIGSAYEALPCNGRDAALRAVDGDRPVAIIADILLGRGADGIEVVQCVRSRVGRLPTLLITGAASLPVSDLTRVKNLGSAIWFAQKPIARELIQRFLDQSTILEALDLADAAELAIVVDDLATRASLRDVDRLLLALVARGMKRQQMADRLGAHPDTLRSRIRRLLERTGGALNDEYKDTRALREKILQLARRNVSPKG